MGGNNTIILTLAFYPFTLKLARAAFWPCVMLLVAEGLIQTDVELGVVKGEDLAISSQILVHELHEENRHS